MTGTKKSAKIEEQLTPTRPNSLAASAELSDRELEHVTAGGFGEMLGAAMKGAGGRSGRMRSYSRSGVGTLRRLTGGHSL
jgi:hypothetical protein